LLQIAQGTTNGGGTIWENFGLYGGDSVLGGIGLQIQSCSGATFSNLSFCNFSTCGLDLSPPGDGIQSVNNNTFGGIFAHVINSTTAIGVRVTGGTGTANTTTTGTFMVAAAGATQVVPVTATTGISVNGYLKISDGTHTIYGIVTNIASLNVTVKTTLVAAGSAGDTMGSGATVVSSTDDDSFENTFTNLFILHNHIGLYLGNCDNNSFYNVQVYSNVSTIVKINGQPGDVYCTTNCRINRIYSMAGYVQCVNGASMAVMSMDPVDASNGPGGPFLPPAYVDSTSYLTITNVDGNGFYPRGTWWYSKGTTATHTFSIFTDDSYYSPIGGAGSQTNDLYFSSPARSSGVPVALATL